MPIGKGGAPAVFSNAFTSSGKLLGNSLRYNTSQKGSPIAIVYGTARATVNVIGGFGFSGTAAGGKKGGAGKGGSKGGKKGGGSYSVNVALSICQGPVSFVGAPLGFSGFNRVWGDGGIAGSNRVPVTYYTGTDVQLPDPVFASSSGDPPILAYAGVAYVAGTPLHLGSTPALPNVQFEITGFGVGTGGTFFPGDANPEWIANDILTNDRYGAGFPANRIDAASWSDWFNYCRASLLAMSYVIDRQQPTARWIEEIVDLTVSAIVWSGAKLRVVPYSLASFVNDGVTWLPDLTWQYSLGDADFLTNVGGSSNTTDPVVVQRIDPAKSENWLSIEYMDAGYAYNQEVIPAFDQNAIDRYGLIVQPAVQGHAFTNPQSATVCLQLMLQRKQFVRVIYKFKLGWRFSLLEPMDNVLITDAALGLVDFPVRIIQIDEDDNGELSISAEDPSGLVVSPTVVPTTPIVVQGSSAVGNFSNAASGSGQLAPLSTVLNNDVVVVAVVAMTNGATGNPVVSSVTSTSGLVFSRLAGGRFQDTNYAFNPNEDVEIWAAVAATPVVGETFTIHMSTLAHGVTWSATVISGLNTSGLVDTNPGAVQFNGSLTSPAVMYSSTHANDIVLFAAGGQGITSNNTAPTGFTRDAALLPTVAGGGFVSGALSHEIVSSPQFLTSVAPGASGLTSGVCALVVLRGID